MHRLLQTLREMLQDEFLPLSSLATLLYWSDWGSSVMKSGVKGLMAVSPDWLKLDQSLTHAWASGLTAANI